MATGASEVTDANALEVRGPGNLMAGSSVVAGKASAATVGTEAAVRASPPRRAEAASTQLCGPAAATIEAEEFPAGEHTALTIDARIALERGQYRGLEQEDSQVQKLLPSLA